MSDPKRELDEVRAKLAELLQDQELRRLTRGTQEQGRRIATIPRPYGDEEVRIILQNFKGNPVTQIGLWRTDEAGRSWIKKDRQYWIRRSELIPVIEGLMEVLQILRDGWESEVKPDEIADEPW